MPTVKAKTQLQNALKYMYLCSPPPPPPQSQEKNQRKQGQAFLLCNILLNASIDTATCRWQAYIPFQRYSEKPSELYCLKLISPSKLQMHK